MLVIAPMPFECEFGAEAEGCTAECQEPALQVRGSSFEEAKKNMEAALQAD